MKRRALVTAAVALLITLPTAAAAASSPDLGGSTKFVWKITNVGATTHHYGDKTTCVEFKAARTGDTAGCTIGTSDGYTISFTLAASFPIKAATVSASVGYQVTHTYTETGTDTFTLKKGEHGYLYFQPDIADNVVTAKEYQCNVTETECNPYPQSGQAVRTTTTHKYKSILIQKHDD